MIPENTVREILETAQVEEVIADFVTLKRSGSNLLGLCPFHDEKTPSFSVSPAKNIYKCFGCGRAGDSVGFLMEHEQLTFVESLRELATRYNIAIEERKLTPDEVTKMDHAESIYGILNYAYNYYQKSLHKSQEGKAIGLTYFQERGLLDRTIEEFQLGYAGNDEGLVDQLRKLGYADDLLKEAGLTNKNGNDFFRNRVIFPIHSLSGKAIGLAGRILGRDNGPKYLNSPESAIYVKNKVLYGMHLAKSHLRKQDKCYLVEGYTDVISLYQNGIKNVVASSGTSLTTNQVSLIRRFASHVTILYDGDQAGIKAALRGVEMMLEADLNVYIVLFPLGKDPDSFVNEIGRDAFEKYIVENEKDFILFQADLELKDIKSDPIKRSAFINSMIKTIAYIQDSVKRSAYVQELSIQTQMAEEIIIVELNKEIKKRLWENQKKQKRQREKEVVSDKIDEAIPAPDYFPKERDLIRILMTGGHIELPTVANITVRDFILEQLRDIPELRHPLYDKIYQQVKSSSDNKWQLNDYKHHDDEEIRNLTIQILSEPIQISENWEKKWDIHLQTQSHPEENFYSDTLQATLRLKLERVILLTQENKKILEALDDDAKIDKHILIQNKLIEMKKDLAYQLGTIVLD